MLKNVKPRVEKLLKEEPIYRDDFNRLLSEIWQEDVQLLANCSLAKVDIINFFLMLRMGELSSPESVRRSWQVLQEKNPELRGKNYNFRHKIVEPQVREEINNTSGSSV